MKKEVQEAINVIAEINNFFDAGTIIKETKKEATPVNLETVIHCETFEYDNELDILVTYQDYDITNYINLSGRSFNVTILHVFQPNHNLCLEITFKTS